MERTHGGRICLASANYSPLTSPSILVVCDIDKQSEVPGADRPRNHTETQYMITRLLRYTRSGAKHDRDS